MRARHLAPVLGPLLVLAGACGGSEQTDGGTGGGASGPPWLSDASILVSGAASTTNDCRTGICRHNENTDLTSFGGAIYFVHRTAQSQILGPNSSLHVYRSTDGGASFAETAVIPAPVDRDLRDPHFYTVGSELYLKALVRLPVVSTRDTGVDTISVATHSADGEAWSALEPIAAPTWSFWRIQEHAGAYYAAAYEDGDLSVVLYSSPDGVTWTAGPEIYGVAVDTPLETELVFMPSGKLLALVRMDGTDDELLGDAGRLRTKICWSDAPYASFDCPAELTGQRLDGPLAFFHGGRLFVVARKHLGANDKKRTALFELTGDLEGGELAITEHGELPSAGDTSYAGQAARDADRTLVTWYSGDIVKDIGWTFGMFDVTDVWQATIDFSKL
ncbi:MAG: hypothetical protein IT373_38175 [Polyangiaceae bacterium]|nr:hypothetical protein [Polyangiaceae bacterium]